MAKTYAFSKQNRKLMVNKSSQIMIQCKSAFNRDAVRRETIDGDDCIVVSSFTLPDNVVMNGGLYSAEEIAKSFKDLENTLAPVEHPHDSNGNLLSAKDPIAINNFHAGVHNANVRQENGRIHIDKIININKAKQSEKGRQLLSRIDELENNDNARPIHTSTGVYLIPEQLNEIRVNDAGKEFTWLATEMVFDHDAILLDSVAAAQPSDGVGMAVNVDGKQCKVEYHTLIEDKKKLNRIAALSGNTDDMSITRLSQEVFEALERSAFDVGFIEELFEDRVIFFSKDNLFEVPFVVDSNGIATIVGIPVPVERNVTFTPKVNHKGDYMKDLILNALKEAGIETEGLTDEQLAGQYKEMLQANQSVKPNSEDKEPALADAIADAIKPLTEQISGLEAKLNANGEAELDSLAELIGNSDKYPGIDTDAAKKLGVETLKGMAANCQESYGLPGNVTHINSQQAASVKTEMPD